MRKILFLLALGLGTLRAQNNPCFTLPASTDYVHPKDDPNFQLVFDEEFNAPEVDKSKWFYKGTIYWDGSEIYLNTSHPWLVKSIDLEILDCVRYPETNKLHFTELGYYDWDNLTSGLTHIPNRPDLDADCADGCLQMAIKDKRGQNFVRDWKTWDYTCSSLYGKQRFKYGYFEVKVKFPDEARNNQLYANEGFSYNLWLNGFCGNDPDINGNTCYECIHAVSEIDMFEIGGVAAKCNIQSPPLPNPYADRTTNYHTSNVHHITCEDPAKAPTACNVCNNIELFCDGYEGNGECINQSSDRCEYWHNVDECEPSEYHVRDLRHLNDVSGFHVFGCRWTPKSVILYYDNVAYDTLYYMSADIVLNRPDVAQVPNGSQKVLPSDFNPMNFILDFTTPGLNFSLTPKSWTVFPAYMYVDHIKVWQKQNDCNQNYQVCNYNSNTYDYRVHKNVNIDGQNCNTVINPSADIQAVEGITVYENTLIEQGILRTEPCEESLHFNWEKTITSKEIQLWQELHSPR